MSEEKFYTSKQLQDWFRISRYALHRAQKNGLPVAKKVGNQHYYRESDVLNYIQRSGGNMESR